VSLCERFGQRDLTYSAWHRPDPIRRYLPEEAAAHLTYIDLDAIEACDDCYEPLALLELARDVGQSHKSTAIMARLARRARVPAGLVFYKPSDDGDIVRFRVRSAWPRGDREFLMTPAMYARWLQSQRTRHQCRPDHHGPARDRGPQRRPTGDQPERRSR
jgi:hypothetical protein